jgi:diguanylate cyclase (GGDEF)-like protein
VVDDEGFWLRHLRLGLVLFTVGILVALLYVILGDPLRPDETITLSFVALASVVCVALLPHRAIVRSSRRIVFFYWWSAFSIAFILLVTSVDGGAGSPLALLLVLPVIYCGLAYPPRAVIVVALGTCGAYLSLAAYGPQAPPGEVVMLAGLIVCTGVSAAAVAKARQRSADELLAVHDSLEEAARRDALTGCLMRGAFHDAVGAELARAQRHQRWVSVVMVDLDDFKAVNDAAGHLAGDQLLDRVGNVLRSSLRAGDEAGRLGGDEFAVLLAEADAFDAARTAERLLVDLAAEGVAASIGVATAMPSDDPSKLLARADAGLYDAKRNGKGRVVVVMV